MPTISNSGVSRVRPDELHESEYAASTATRAGVSVVCPCEVGHCIVKVDYSQIELRIAALVAQETAMLTAFRADLHRLTAARVLGRAPETVTSADRQLAKALNFGLLYGMGATRRSMRSRITRCPSPNPRRNSIVALFSSSTRPYGKKGIGPQAPHFSSPRPLRRGRWPSDGASTWRSTQKPSTPPSKGPARTA